MLAQQPKGMRLHHKQPTYRWNGNPNSQYNENWNINNLYTWYKSTNSQWKETKRLAAISDLISERTNAHNEHVIMDLAYSHNIV